ncbi:hypothetical protein SAY86_014632 [Trapa natans]|uniref:MYB transcription factor n=1 Tax=Trapa natans TaxID=22666 RepID=A0AAN7KMQ2_TRANT|nr:hypothetical protein SAY86_014632 [Trapa natans]
MTSNSPSSNPQPMAASVAPASNSSADASEKKVRKPYTITKSRESWSEEEHDKFLEALQLFDRDWKKIEDFVGSKTVIQIRSHAQKYFLKVQKNGTVAHVPPPRPKRKAAHPYPQKANKNVSLPPQVSSAQASLISTFAITTGHAQWDDSSILISTSSGITIPSQDELTNLQAAEEGATRTNNSSVSGGSMGRKLPSSDVGKREGPVLHGLPDFAEVYSFIGSVFDPDTKNHMQKLKEMDPINFETALLLMRNLTFNLASPGFEPTRNFLSSYDNNNKTGGVSLGVLAKNQSNVCS